MICLSLNNSETRGNGSQRNGNQVTKSLYPNLATTSESELPFLYTQVWNPNENVLKRLRDLEFKCSNTTLEWERHLDRLQRRVLNEMISARYLHFEFYNFSQAIAEHLSVHTNYLFYFIYKEKLINKEKKYF